MVPFVTFELAPDQVLPASVEAIDLIMAQPVGQGGRMLLPFQFVARNVGPHLATTAEEALEAACYGFNTRYHDPVTGRWEAEGAFDIGSEADPVLQLIPGLMDRIDLPWLHIDREQRLLRLVPLSDLDVFPLQAVVEKTLRQTGQSNRVVLSYQDYNEYAKWKSRLAPPDQAQPRSFF